MICCHPIVPRSSAHKACAFALMAAVAGCESKPRSVRSSTSLDDTIEVAAISKRNDLRLAVITDAVRDSILVSISEGEPGLQLSLDALAFMTEKGVVVSDRHRVHILDRNGSPLRVIGRSGEGPGEFRNIRGICEAVGDTLVVFDGNLRRISVFDAEGRFVRAFSVGIGYLPGRNGCFADGTFIVSRSKARDQSSVNRSGLTGVVTDSSLSMNFDWTLGGFQIMVSPAIAAFRDMTIMGDPWEGTIRVHQGHGVHNKVFKLTGLHPDVIPENQVAVWSTSGQPISRPAKRKYFPYFQEFRVTPNGTFWYNDFPRNSHESAKWYAFDSTGTRVAALELDSSAVVNKWITLEDFDDSKVLLRIEHDTRGAVFRIVPFENLRPRGSSVRR